MNKAHNSWTKQVDGSWEAVINGTTYLIEKEDELFYIYRLPSREQIGTSKSLIEAICEADKHE